MQNFYLVRWLQENSELDPDIIDSLKYELDSRIYFYGKQFAFPLERAGAQRMLDGLKFWAKERILRYKKIQAATSSSGKVKISSNAYFPFNNVLSENGFDPCPVPWQIGGLKTVDAEFNFLISRVNHVLRFGDFKDLISRDFASDIAALKNCFKAYFERENIKALVVPYDLPFFERLAIKVFKELGRPSIVSLHGLPGRYNNRDDNRADYLLVWGDKIKEYYVRAGIEPDKIFVTGHTGYSLAAPQTLAVPQTLRFALDNVLVIAKTMPGAQHSAEEVLSDRGNIILYLYSMRSVLQKNGVRRVRLRLHPSGSADWYRRFLAGDFFQFDQDSLQNSISKASLVIGPTSTVFIESLMAGVNYLVYEPMSNGRDLMNWPIVPPFDGSEPGIPVAHSEENLQRLLSERETVNPAVIPGYVKLSLDLSPITTILQKNRRSYQN